MKFPVVAPKKVIRIFTVGQKIQIPAKSEKVSYTHPKSKLNQSG